MSNTSKRTFVLASLAAACASGCVMVPVANDGTPIYPTNAAVYPGIVVPVPTVQGPGPNYLAPVPGRSNRAQSAPSSYGSAYGSAGLETAVPSGPNGPAMPAALQARLYPSNEVATETGLLSGSVTNMMTGKGMFQINYRGEILTGEATRVPGDDRRGLANAYGQRGTYMSCEYRMTTPYQGTGTCKFSNGAQYQVHIGG